MIGSTDLAQILTVFVSILEAKTVKIWAKSVEPIKSYANLKLETHCPNYPVLLSELYELLRIKNFDDPIGPVLVRFGGNYVIIILKLQFIMI